MKILVDTNALMYAVRNKVDLADMLRKKYGLPEMLVPTQVIDEIKRLKLSHKSEDRIAANIALDMIKQRKFIELKLAGFTDDAILDYAKQYKTAVVTNDLELRQRLKELGLQVLCIRQKKYLMDW